MSQRTKAATAVAKWLDIMAWLSSLLTRNLIKGRTTSINSSLGKSQSIKATNALHKLASQNKLFSHYR